MKKVSPLGTQLTWSYCRALLSIKDYDKINYYINLTINNNLSKRESEEKIKHNEYERLPEETKNKLIKKEKSEVKDFVKNLIFIKNKYNNEIVSEKILQRLILEDIENFMKELGDSFCFIGSEYKNSEPYIKAIAMYVAENTNIFFNKNKDTGVDSNSIKDDTFKNIFSSYDNIQF